MFCRLPRRLALTLKRIYSALGIKAARFDSILKEWKTVMSLHLSDYSRHVRRVLLSVPPSLFTDILTPCRRDAPFVYASSLVSAIPPGIL